MDSVLFHHPLFPPFSTTTRYLTNYAPPKLPLFSATKLQNLACRGLGTIGGNENGSVFGVFGSNAGEKDNSESFKTVDAEITPETVDFFVSDRDGDPDCPTDGFSSVEDALATLRLGKFVIVVDDENGDIEGNIVFGASFATPETIGFLMRHGSGIISVGMTSEDLERLNLPLMSPENEHNSAAPSFTITVDAIDTSTGVSSSDRAKTILALGSPTSGPGSFRRPGHVFPLKYRNGGVLRRAGHTEASVDLVKLAGLDPVSVLSTIVNPEDGSIAPLNNLRKLALDHDIPLVLITDLIRYRRKRERLVERVAVSRLPTTWGLFEAYCYRSKLDGTEHIAVVKGDIGNGRDVLVRVHSECLTGDIFGSGRCDCGNQLALAMEMIEVIIVSSSSKVKGGISLQNPFTLKVGQVFTGFGVGCGLGIGVGRPLNLGAIPMLNQVMVAARGASDIFSGAGRHVNRSLKMVGAKNIEAGIGCGVGFGHGFGVGLAIKPGVINQIQTCLITTATKLMTRFGVIPNLSTVAGGMLPQSLQSGNSTISPLMNLATGTKSRDGDLTTTEKLTTSFSSSFPSRTDKVISNFLQSPLVEGGPSETKVQAGQLHSEKDVIQLVLKQQLALEKLKEENDKLQRILVEDLKVSPDKFKVNGYSGYTCSDCIECRRKQRRDRSGR